MKLYWAPQSRAIRALWLLEEAGLRYERVLVDIRKGEQAHPEFLAINPMGKVPTLVDGDTVVTESGAIVAHVADRAPAAALAPAVGDPARGAYYRWLFFSGGCIEPAYMQKMAGWTVNSSTAAWSSYDRVIDVLDAALQKAPYLLGERFTAADLLIGSDLYFGVRLFNMVEPRPVFTAYIDRLAARPAFLRAQAIEAAGV